MISILMCFRNEAAFLDDCLNSILSQTEKDWELIAVNDHSTDSSREILNLYSKNNDRIVLLENDGRGIIHALRLAFRNTTGNLITRMDADDMMPPWKLKSLKEKMQSLEPMHVATGMVHYFSRDALQEGFINYASWLNAINAADSHFHHIYKECVVASPAWMANKADLIKINAFEEAEYPEDYDMVFKWYKYGFKISAVPEVIHYWRDHPDRASRNDPNYRDNLFPHLKCKYFLEIDHNPLKQLFLWGAGKKAKRIAKELLSRNQEFIWMTDNEKKIGKQIYGQAVTSIQLLPENNRQVIVAISDKQFLQEKETLYDKFELKTEERFEFT